MGIILSKNVTIVTVTYNSMAVLPNMLKSIPKATAIVIIDNASNDIAELKHLVKNLNVTLILNKKIKALQKYVIKEQPSQKQNLYFFLIQILKLKIVLL